MTPNQERALLNKIERLEDDIETLRKAVERLNMIATSTTERDLSSVYSNKKRPGVLADRSTFTGYLTGGSN